MDVESGVRGTCTRSAFWKVERVHQTTKNGRAEATGLVIKKDYPPESVHLSTAETRREQKLQGEFGLSGQSQM